MKKFPLVDLQSSLISAPMSPLVPVSHGPLADWNAEWKILDSSSSSEFGCRFPPIWVLRSYFRPRLLFSVPRKNNILHTHVIYGRSKKGGLVVVIRIVLNVFENLIAYGDTVSHSELCEVLLITLVERCILIKKDYPSPFPYPVKKLVNHNNECYVLCIQHTCTDRKQFLVIDCYVT